MLCVTLLQFGGAFFVSQAHFHLLLCVSNQKRNRGQETQGFWKKYNPSGGDFLQNPKGLTLGGLTLVAYLRWRQREEDILY